MAGAPCNAPRWCDRSGFGRSWPVPDLVIGGRRPSAIRPLRVVAIAGLLVVIATLVAYVVYRRVVAYAHPGGSVSSAPLVTESAGATTRLAWGEGASLERRGRLGVLRLAGDPHQIGAARGRLLGAPVALSERALHDSIGHAIDRGGWFGDTTYAARLRWRFRLLDDGIPGHHLVEVAGQVRGAARSGADIGYEDAVRARAAIDVGAPLPWSVGADLRALTASLSVVTTSHDERGDRILVGRSLSLPGLALPDDVVVSFVRPAPGDQDILPYATIGWPGQVGALSGVNSAGLAVLVHPVRTADVRVMRSAEPTALLARDILEHARSLGDAIAVLEQAEPLGAAAFVLVDGSARTWAIVERSPGGIEVIRKPASAAITDLLAGNSFVDDPEIDRARRSRPSAARATRAAALVRERTPTDAAAMASILRDRRGASGAALPLGHRGALDDPGAAHTVILDPSAMLLWVSEGPGAAGRFRGFDLRHELSGTEPAAPPADVPADETLAPAAAEAVRRARAELREARRAGGKRGRELAERAISWAPDLPEALLVAGELARATGDHEVADRYLRRYLEVGPDDLGAEERIRARLFNH